MIRQLETLFKALGEPTRLKIVKLVSVQEMCVCELEAVLDMSQPRVSQHLKVLKLAGIVKERKERQKSFFSLEESLKTGQMLPFSTFMAADIGELSEFASESERLSRLEDNEAVRSCKESLDQPIETIKIAR